MLVVERDGGDKGRVEEGGTNVGNTNCCCCCGDALFTSCFTPENTNGEERVVVGEEGVLNVAPVN